MLKIRKHDKRKKSLNVILPSAPKAEAICPAKTCQNSIKKTSRCLQLRSWNGVGCVDYGTTGSLSVCKAIDNKSIHHQCSPKRNHPQPNLLVQPVRTPLNGVSGKCLPYIHMRAALPLFIFILDLQSERWAAPLVCVDWREGEHWKINKRQQKEKASRIKKGRGLLWPKTLLHTSVFRCKGSEVDLSISYFLQRVAKNDQGKARHEVGDRMQRKEDFLSQQDYSHYILQS